MPSPVARRVNQLGYDRTRLLLLSTGFVVLAVVAVVTYVRRVETVEVVATLLFIPVFLGVAFGRVRGGVIMGAIASGVYVALRYPAIDAIGWSDFAGLITSRTTGFLLFGAIGGWADQTLEASLHRLDIVDITEDATGLNNAWYFVLETDREMSRVDRYGTVFSVVDCRFPGATLSTLARRDLDRLLRRLGDTLKADTRGVDHVTFATDHQSYHVTAILPHADAAAAEQFRARFETSITDLLTEGGAPPPAGSLTTSVLTYPGDEDVLARMRDEFHHLDEFEHGHVHDEVLPTLEHQV